jgi:hypothetical protein
LSAVKLNIRDAHHKIQESKPHLLLTALRLGTGDTLEFLKALKSEISSTSLRELFPTKIPDLFTAVHITP